MKTKELNIINARPNGCFKQDASLVYEIPGSNNGYNLFHLGPGPFRFIASFFSLKYYEKARKKVTWKPIVCEYSEQCAVCKQSQIGFINKVYFIFFCRGIKLESCERWKLIKTGLQPLETLLPDGKYLDEL